jgi:hypothetical protein
MLSGCRTRTTRQSDPRGLARAILRTVHGFQNTRTTSGCYTRSVSEDTLETLHGQPLTGRRRIELDDLRGLPGLRESAKAALVAAQPRTTADACWLQGVGRKTARVLCEAGFLTDPYGVLVTGEYIPKSR